MKPDPFITGRRIVPVRLVLELAGTERKEMVERIKAHKTYSAGRDSIPLDVALQYLCDYWIETETMDDFRRKLKVYIPVPLQQSCANRATELGITEENYYRRGLGSMIDVIRYTELVLHTAPAHIPGGTQKLLRQFNMRLYKCCALLAVAYDVTLSDIITWLMHLYLSNEDTAPMPAWIEDAKRRPARRTGRTPGSR